MQYAGRLLDANSSRVISDPRERMAASRRSLEHELSRLLTGLADAAGRALQHARQAGLEGEATLARAVAHIESQRDALNKLKAGLH